LSSNISEKLPKRKRKETKEQKVDTKAETLRLYQQGKSLNQIAAERNLTVQTIEGHLSYYVQNGSIKIDDLVSREKIVLIEPEARKFTGGPIASLKEKFGNKATWGEIRLVLASIEYQKSSAHVNH
jgi:uncharacterized protein YpbB